LRACGTHFHFTRMRGTRQYRAHPRS
jgi:hypothetical protein